MTSKTLETRVTEAERRRASEQALASSLIEGHTPTPEFLADVKAVNNGTMTNDELRARSLARALDADNAALRTQEEPAFLDNDGPSAEIPPFITTTNARELYEIRPGETVSEAIARRNAKGT
ncbi:MAG: antitoxin VbhA family protein [Rhodoferax sp.]